MPAGNVILTTRVNFISPQVDTATQIGIGQGPGGPGG